MNKSQLNAISYAITKRDNDKLMNYLKVVGKYDDFKESKYQTMKNYIKFALGKNWSSLI